MTVWIDASGAIIGPPLDHREIVGDVCITAVVTCLVAACWYWDRTRWPGVP